MAPNSAPRHLYLVCYETTSKSYLDGSIEYIINGDGSVNAHIYTINCNDNKKEIKFKLDTSFKSFIINDDFKDFSVPIEGLKNKNGPSGWSQFVINKVKVKKSEGKIYLSDTSDNITIMNSNSVNTDYGKLKDKINSMKGKHNLDVTVEVE